MEEDGTGAERAVERRTGQEQSIRVDLRGAETALRIAAMQQRVDAKYAGDA